MVLGMDMNTLYLSCGLCHSIRPQSTRKRVVNKKCRFYGKRKFNVIYGAILHYDQCSVGPPLQFDMTPIDTEEGVNKKCRFYGKCNFNVIYGAILHYDQCSFGPPRRFDMVLGMEMTSLYMSCGLCDSISPQTTRKWVVNTCKFWNPKTVHHGSWTGTDIFVPVLWIV
eukprot:scaffold123853_cov65-Attheya_sp.AAC.1